MTTFPQVRGTVRALNGADFGYNENGPTGASTPAGPDHQSFIDNERGCG